MPAMPGDTIAALAKTLLVLKCRDHGVYRRSARKHLVSCAVRCQSTSV
jgi:hypothetical protein